MNITQAGLSVDTPLSLDLEPPIFLACGFMLEFDSDSTGGRPIICLLS
jgi:hypothetical protein